MKLSAATLNFLGYVLEQGKRFNSEPYTDSSTIRSFVGTFAEKALTKNNSLLIPMSSPMTRRMWAFSDLGKQVASVGLWVREAHTVRINEAWDRGGASELYKLREDDNLEEAIGLALINDFVKGI